MYDHITPLAIESFRRTSSEAAFNQDIKMFKAVFALLLLIITVSEGMEILRLLRNKRNGSESGTFKCKITVGGLTVSRYGGDALWSLTLTRSTPEENRNEIWNCTRYSGDVCGTTAVNAGICYSFHFITNNNATLYIKRLRHDENLRQVFDLRSHIEGDPHPNDIMFLLYHDLHKERDILLSAASNRNESLRVRTIGGVKFLFTTINRELSAAAVVDPSE